MLCFSLLHTYRSGSDSLLVPSTVLCRTCGSDHLQDRQKERDWKCGFFHSFNIQQLRKMRVHLVFSKVETVTVKTTNLITRPGVKLTWNTGTYLNALYPKYLFVMRNDWDILKQKEVWASLEDWGTMPSLSAITIAFHSPSKTCWFLHRRRNGCAGKAIQPPVLSNFIWTTGYSTQCLWLKATPLPHKLAWSACPILWWGKCALCNHLTPVTAKLTGPSVFWLLVLWLPVVMLQKEPYVPSDLGCDALHHLSTCW